MFDSLAMIYHVIDLHWCWPSQVIAALGKTWHVEHFVCAHCEEPLGTRNFYERDSLAYCETDYHHLFAPRCAYCNGPIVDVSLQLIWIKLILKSL